MQGRLIFPKCLFDDFSPTTVVCVCAFVSTTAIKAIVIQRASDDSKVCVVRFCENAASALERQIYIERENVIVCADDNSENELHRAPPHAYKHAAKTANAKEPPGEWNILTVSSSKQARNVP